ncbi:hypothetical protein K474DRAFT_1606486 [Panus rudis PR-1116 ss-1]|nr:hypothetical protein K474DRAFT_1606486 [Panus rudis PR-1116 ss-1]
MDADESSPPHVHPSLSPASASASTPAQQTQPKTVKLSPKALLTLPYRLVHPPPVKNKVPSWSITPQFKINLQDVLDRKHLPPLGLKDFEEWLLFVDNCAENLYVPLSFVV